MKLTDEMLEQLLSQQAEQAGEIWERGLPDEPEQPHTFSKRFERRMRWLIWRRRHPMSTRMMKQAAVLLLCIGIGTGALVLAYLSMPDDTLSQIEAPSGSASLQTEPEEDKQIQPDIQTDTEDGTLEADDPDGVEEVPDDTQPGQSADTPEEGAPGGIAGQPDDGQPGSSTDTPTEPSDSDDTQEPPDNTDPTPSEPPEEPGDGDDTQEPPITTGPSLCEPSYVPAGMVAVSRQESETELMIRYAASNGKMVTYTSKYSANPQLSGTGETVSVSDAAAAVFRSNGEQNTLEWIDASACYALVGNLSKDELLNMANSTKN